MPATRHVYYCLDVLPPTRLRGALWRRLESRAVARADVLVVSEAAKLEAWPRRTGASFEVPNVPQRKAADDVRLLRDWARPTLRRSCGWPEDALVLLHAGGVADEFAVAEEFGALRLLEEDHVRLVFMGRNRSSSRETFGGLVHWAGQVSDREWLQWLAAADVGLAISSRSLTEGERSWNSPLSWNRLYWYLAAGLPIVAGGHPALDRFVSERGVGVIAAGIAPELIAGAVRHVLAHRPDFAAAASASYSIKLQNYDLQVETAMRSISSAASCGW